MKGRYIIDVLAIATLTVIAVAASLPFFSSNKTQSRDCSTVTDKVVVSPGGSKRAHLLNQSCAYGFGVGFSSFWVSVGGDVATVGRQDRVDQLAPEASVAFKTLTFEPHVSWADDRTLVISVDEVAPIYKSLHALDDTRIKYKIADELSHDRYVGRLNQIEPRLRKSYLKEYDAFETWAKQNAD